jgi:hypothetical protein
MRIAFGGVAAALVFAVAADGTSRAADRNPIGHYQLKTRGVRAYFENRFAPSGWSSGQVVREIATNPEMQQDIAVELDHIRVLGVNEIGFELRSVGDVPDNQPPPDCTLSWWLGAQWPDPLPSELAGLRVVLRLVREHGMKLVLHLTNTHHDAPEASQERWLGPLLLAVKDDPAFDFVTFDGDVKLHSDGQCGGQSEAALWNGFRSPSARYVSAAIRYGMKLGIAPRQLTAETIIPFPYSPHEPVEVLKEIFDEIGVPNEDRTYALSHYERESTPHQYADAALEHSFAIIGKTPRDPHGPRVLFSEFGVGPVTPNWTASNVVESFGVLMNKYGLDGGIYWLWAQMNATDEDRHLPPAIKRRGPWFVYNPIVAEFRDLYGFHLESIPGSSFETGWRADWRISGKGKVRRAAFVEAPRLPWRGKTVLQLVGAPTISANSRPIRVSGGTTYTTAGDFQVARKGSSVTFRYATCAGRASSEHKQTRFALSKSARYKAFAFRYRTPSDACFVRIQVTAVRGRVLADNLR